MEWKYFPTPKILDPELKQGYLQKMFPKNGSKFPQLRFAGFADAWEQRKFKDILKTHSFRSYLAGVSENGEYEVIQQGDKPIVGYSDGEPFTDYKDVTLFGEHTVSLYKPKSPFFVATDGVKILSADNFEGDYLYTTLERYKPEPQGYKRHFTILKNQDAVTCFGELHIEYKLRPVAIVNVYKIVAHISTHPKIINKSGLCR